MANILTKLKINKHAEVKNTETEEAVAGVKGLLENEAVEENVIIRALAKNSSLGRLENARGKKIELEQLDGKYEGNVFHVDTIKKLARKYNMRFLRAVYFSGNMNIEVVRDVKSFIKKNGLVLSEGSVANMFYVLAPETEFNLKKVKLTKIRPRRNPDPAIFYMIDDKHFRFIKQWGNDFNVFNWIAGLNWRSRQSKFFTHWILFLLLHAGLLFGAMKIINPPLDGIFWVVNAALFVFSFLYSALNAWNDDIWSDGSFHEKKWNSNTMYLPGKRVVEA